MPFPFDFLLNENMKDFVVIPMWSTVVSGILTTLWELFIDKRESPVNRRLRSAEFQANPFPQNLRTEVHISGTSDDSSKSELPIIILMIVAILCLHIPFRVGVLNVLSIVIGLSFGFSLVVSIFSIMRGTWPEDAWVIGCMLACCLFLFVGLGFVRDPPRPTPFAVAAFLATGQWSGHNPQLNDIVDLFGLGVSRVAGFFFLLHGPVRSMVFLGIGTVVRPLYRENLFCSWLASLTRNTINHRFKTFVIYILIEGTVGLLLIGGWGFEWYSNIWTAIQHLGQ
jgi:hypothetical protein